MRIYLFTAIAITLLASCSAPKYTYHFDHYDYTSGRKNSNVGNTSPKPEKTVDKNPLAVDTKQYTASIDNSVVPIPSTKELTSATSADTETKTDVKTDKTVARSAKESLRRYKEMSKTQRNEFRKGMRENMRRYIVPRRKKNN